MTFDSLERLNLTSLNCSIEPSILLLPPNEFRNIYVRYTHVHSKEQSVPSWMLHRSHGRHRLFFLNTDGNLDMFPCGLLIDSSSRQDSNHASKSVRGIKLSLWKLELQATRSFPNAKHPLPSENTQPLVESSGKLTQRIWSSDFIGVEIFQRGKEFEREVVRGIRRTAK